MSTPPGYEYSHSFSVLPNWNRRFRVTGVDRAVNAAAAGGASLAEPISPIPIDFHVLRYDVIDTRVFRYFGCDV